MKVIKTFGALPKKTDSNHKDPPTNSSFDIYVLSKKLTIL